MELIKKFQKVDETKKMKYLMGGLAAIVVLSKLKRLVFGVVPRGTIIELEIGEKRYVETEVDRFTKAYFQDLVVFRELIEALEIATNDKNVAGLVFRVGANSSLTLAQTEELRNSLENFKSKGKKIFAFAEGLGEFSLATKHYYLISVADAIYIPPCTDVNVSSLLVEQPFIRKALEEKLGIVPQIHQRKDYKNAANFFMEEKFTAAHKESVQALVDSIHEIIFEAISKSRKLSIEKVKELFSKVTFSAAEAKENNLIDGLGYEYEVYNTIMPAFFGATNLKKTNLTNLFMYYEKTGPLFSQGIGRSAIALVSLEGNIHTGKSASFWDSNGTSIGSTTVVSTIREITQDKSIKAVIVRINSGGGSYIASDMILNALMEAKKAGKKIIFNFSGVAASGGYFVGQLADKIVCQPSTITGSIGVFAGKFYTREMWAKLGVSFDFLVPNEENATLFSWRHKYTEKQVETLNHMLDRIYNDFVTKAAKGRNKSFEEMEKLAQGRVWMGTEAKKHGLVDEYGGLLKAIEVAKREANISGKIQLKTFPKARNWATLFQKPKNSQEASGVSSSSSSSFLSTIFNTFKLSSMLFQLLSPSLPFAQRMIQQTQNSTSALASPQLNFEETF